MYKAALSEMQAEQRRLEQQIVDERAEIDVRLSAVACRRVGYFRGALGTLNPCGNGVGYSRVLGVPYGNGVLLKGVPLVCR